MRCHSVFLVGESCGQARQVPSAKQVPITRQIADEVIMKVCDKSGLQNCEFGTMKYPIPRVNKTKLIKNRANRRSGNRRNTPAAEKAKAAQTMSMPPKAKAMTIGRIAPRPAS
jgi:hypothetical protein